MREEDSGKNHKGIHRDDVTSLDIRGIDEDNNAIVGDARKSPSIRAHQLSLMRSEWRRKIVPLRKHKDDIWSNEDRVVNMHVIVFDTW